MSSKNVKNIAILWDIENVTPSGSDNIFVQSLWDYADSMGRVVVSYAYADWSRKPFSSLGPTLATFHFYMSHVPYQNKRRVKNGSDMHLVSDALDLVQFYDHIDTFILVTGDSDFRPVLLTLRKMGKSIHIVCDFKNAAQDLLNLADSFTDYRDLIPSNDDEDEVTESSYDKKSSSEPTHSREYWYERLAETAKILQDEHRTCNMSTAKTKMKMLNRDFNEKTLGFRQWSSFISAAVKAGYIRSVTTDNENEILPAKDIKQGMGSLQNAFRELIEVLKELDGKKGIDFHPFSVVNKKLFDRGISHKSLGFAQFKKFLSSAEARSLVETKIDNFVNYVKLQS